jgi:serine/threonine protein kinase
MSYIHAKGIIHRDLNSRNILLTDQGHAKVRMRAALHALPSRVYRHIVVDSVRRQPHILCCCPHVSMLT